MNQSQLIAVSVSCAVVILVVGLVVTLVLAQRASAKGKAGGTVVPPVNPDAPIQPVRTLTCAPFSTKAADFQLVPCDSQAKCNGCKEFTDASNQYACVAVTGGNGMVNSAGQLVHPLEVTFKVPPSVPPKSCSGHGQLNKDGTCTCDDGYTGTACNLTRLRITTPGSYCLPAYAQLCDTATTESVLVNEAYGKGGQYECRCKPEYKGMFTQAVQGGPCDVPLICDAASPQMEANMEDVKMYSVYAGKDDSAGDPIFVQQPVFTNKVAAYEAGTDPCTAKVAPPSDGCEGADAAHCKPYQQGLLAEDADPTCHAVLVSNKCTSSFATDKDALGVSVVVRGSNKPGDPLKQRVYPAYYPPVPPALQRCPDGYSGDNTPYRPCRKVDVATKNVTTLKFKPSLESQCADETNPVDVHDAKSYGSVWYDAVFGDDGEWNGYFTCVADLKTARVLVDGKEMPVMDMPWATVVPSPAGDTVNEVSCVETSSFTDWRVRGGDRDGRTQSCKGQTGCIGVAGFQQAQWDGYANGNLVNDKGDPWFAYSSLNAKPPQPTYGGQCACEGVTYREDVQEGKTVMTPVPLVPGYLMQNTGNQNWWSCVVDTCRTPETPSGHLIRDADATFMHPRCDCGSSAQHQAAPPYTTYMSYRPTGQSPTCVRDSCNPGGVRTTSKIFCSPDDEENKCQGTCYSDHRCYLTSDEPCSTDLECVNKVSPSLRGVCKKKGSEEKGKCMYVDPDRAHSHCDTNADCSYGTCTNVETVQVRQKNGQVVPVTRGTCSGGCACDIEYVQRPDNSSPLGYTCKKRCDETPCVAANTKEPCRVDRETGEQVCVCKSKCFGGDRCEQGNVMSREGEACIPNQRGPDGDKDGYPVKFGDYGYCCEGTCEGKAVDSGGRTGVPKIAYFCSR